MRRTSLAAAVAALSALAVPGIARGDGLPLPGVLSNPDGIADRAAKTRYVTFDAGRDTVVARLATKGARVEHSRLLKGRFTVPAVALDGSPSGLSEDERTLVLIRPRRGFPQRTTTLTVLSAKSLRTRRAITLRGDFSFDAISPDGRRAYLVHYVSRRDMTRYVVRALDLRSGRLLPGAIVDPREPDERMGGYPLTRATSPDGRWAYTLYDGVGHEPFIHALDTVGNSARCIDLEALEGARNLSVLRLRVAPGGGSLVVADKTAPVLAVDTRSFAVGPPRAAGTRRPARTSEQDDAMSWPLAAAGGVALLGLGSVLRRRNRAAARRTRRG
jgi:hypothetical protein